jgi:transcriptional regulator with XRE-family HTH domain
MNKIEQLRDHIRKSYPTATTELTRPLHKGGIWSLDVNLSDKHLDIQWSPTTKFGLSSVSNESFGEGPDETFEQLEPTQRRVDQLLETAERTSPAFPILISRLRERRGITQQEMANRLGVRQATISGMEHRDDVQISTLRRVIEALEGALEIFAVFPDSRYRINMPRFDYVSSSAPTLGLKTVETAKPERLHAQVFTLLEENGALPRASEIALSIRAEHAVLEMIN